METDRVLTECVTGRADRQSLSEHLHAIDSTAASIRQEIGRLDGEGRPFHD